ncbi:hypothetical protein [Castellaniella sp.]|uniref:hypothetical protein n=1 Tax=Castellaniella sp. TaxID=1955812 RepID=UPI002AFF171C|nr:hypothetical protein [Castellaniella sp.]
MPVTRHLPMLFRQSLLTCSLALYALSIPSAAQASPASDALENIQKNTWIERTITLRDAGLTDPITLSNNDMRQEFFFPVPRDITLSDAHVQFQGAYLKSTANFASLALLIDEQPAWGARVKDHDGQLDTRLPVSNGLHENGFVRLGIDWSFNTHLRACEIDRSRTNALTIDPDTQLRYRYDLHTLPSLESAWGTLPHDVILTIPDEQLDRTAYDSAWRLGTALERSGRRVTVQALPKVGSQVHINKLAVPEGLLGIPAFDALSQPGTLTIQNDAQLAALLILQARAVVGDVALSNPAFASRIQAMIVALEAQLQTDPEALAQYKNWVKQRIQLPFSQSNQDNIAVTLLGTIPLIVVKDNAGLQAASLFDSVWKGLLKTKQLNAILAHPPVNDTHHSIPLDSLGGNTSSFNVVAQGDWFANFPLGAVVANGRVPNQLLIDVSAAPGASATQPVASVFWNGILLSAQRLQAHGHPERLLAQVPGYALGVSNSVRVSFQRQPSSADCDEIPQGFPVDVLPTSHVRLGPSGAADSFIGVLPKLTDTPDLILPEAYLQHAADSLSQVVRLSNASALSPWGARLVLAKDGETITPERAFLSMEVPIAGTTPRILVAQNHLQINGQRTDWLDVIGLNDLSAAEVTKAGEYSGILWHALGTQSSAAKRPFVLNRGDLVVIGNTGPAVWIDSSNPSASLPPGAEGSPFFEWRNYLSWGIPVGAFILFLILLTMLMARRARSKRRPE